MQPLPFVNTQPAEKPDYREGGSLDVQEVFATIQGEGPFAGRRAVFVRLAGCSLQCPSCDTDYTSDRKRQGYTWTHIDIKKAAKEWKGTGKLVVLTGGEPLRQNVFPLCDLLASNGWNVQIETNGIHDFKYEYFPDDVDIVCSPKTGSINELLKPKILCLKYVLEAGKVDPDDGLPLSVLGLECRVARPWPEFYGEIYVQPQDDRDPVKNKANLDAAIKSCMKFGYRLSVQTHKIAGLP